MESLKKFTSGPGARFRRFAYGRVPLWIRRRDFELFTLLLCFSAGLPLIITRKVEADSMEATLPFVAVYTWSIVLAFAPLLVVMGAAMSYRRVGLHSFRWIRWEVFGLRILSYAAYLYAAMIVVNGVFQHGVFQPISSIVIIFGFACTSRAWGLLEEIEAFWQRAGVDLDHA